MGAHRYRRPLAPVANSACGLSAARGRRPRSGHAHHGANQVPGKRSHAHSHILVIRPGHHLDPRDRVRRRDARPSRRPAGVRAASTRARAGSSTTPRRSGHHARHRARGAGQRRPDRRATSPRSASPTSARPWWSGTARTGKPIHNAIVWQDRRTASCASAGARGPRHAGRGNAPACCSIPTSPPPRSPGCWTHVAGARAAAERGELAFGTVDTLPALAADRRRRACDRRHQRLAHAAVRHPSRRLGRRPAGAVRHPARACCPTCATARRISARPRPTCSAAPIPIRGIAGDQQAALIGQACFKPGHGEVDLRHGLLRRCSTPARRRSLSATGCSPPSPTSCDGVRTYALEGSIFVAGAAVQWLRDGLGLIAVGRRNRRAGRRRRPGAGGLPGAGLRRPRRAALGPRGARRC